MLTDREREVYDYVRAYLRRHGVAPKLREIAAHLGIASRGVVHRYLRRLEAQGLIAIDPARARGVRLPAPTGRAGRGAVLPLLGRIAAGQPIEAVENPESISLGDITRSKDVFVLQVKGESMKDEHIVDGDYVLVEKGNTARDGEIVVALVDNTEATPKRLYREGQNIRLQPSNVTMKPIIVPARSVQVQGRVIGVLRKY